MILLSSFNNFSNALSFLLFSVAFAPKRGPLWLFISGQVENMGVRRAHVGRPLSRAAGTGSAPPAHPCLPAPLGRVNGGNHLLHQGRRRRHGWHRAVQRLAGGRGEHDVGVGTGLAGTSGGLPLQGVRRGVSVFVIQVAHHPKMLQLLITHSILAVSVGQECGHSLAGSSIGSLTGCSQGVGGGWGLI